MIELHKARHADRLDIAHPGWYNDCFITESYKQFSNEDPPTVLDRSLEEHKHDTPLSNSGIWHAQKLARKLAHENYDLIFSSPALRSVQTANEVLKRQKKCSKLRIEPGLFESIEDGRIPSWLSPQDYEGLDYYSVEQQYDPVYTVADMQKNHVDEDYGQFLSRCRRVTFEILSKVPDDSKILFVGHACTLFANDPLINYSDDDAKRNYVDLRRDVDYCEMRRVMVNRQHINRMRG